MSPSADGWLTISVKPWPQYDTMRRDVACSEKAEKWAWKWWADTWTMKWITKSLIRMTLTKWIGKLIPEIGDACRKVTFNAQQVDGWTRMPTDEDRVPRGDDERSSRWCREDFLSVTNKNKNKIFSRRRLFGWEQSKTFYLKTKTKTFHAMLYRVILYT